jgi:hypothetical protein
VQHSTEEVLGDFPKIGFIDTPLQVNVTVAIANWEGISRKASARDNRKGLK